MEETNQAINPLPEEQLKERMNFAKMFERQGQQIKQTAHITNLLNPSQNKSNDHTGQAELKSRIEKLEDHYNMSTIQQRFDQLEEKISGQLDHIQSPKKIKLDIQIKNRRHAYYIAAIFTICAILFGYIAKPETKTKIQEKIVYKETPKKEIPKFYMTKFVNIRTHASTSAGKITTLSPNSIVEIIEVQKDWKKIKYVDHLNKKTVIGWAYGENLKAVK